MAESITLAATHKVTPTITALVYDWVCSAAGGLGQFITPPISGHLLTIETIPGRNGDKITNVPTDLYDIYPMEYRWGTGTILIDGSNRSSSIGQRITLTQPKGNIFMGQLLIYGVNMGIDKEGRIILFIKNK